MAELNDPASGSWHLDKRVPVAMIITLIGHAAASIWFAAALAERVSNLERQVATMAPQADRLTRVEVKIESIKEGIARIERLIQNPPAAIGR